jgi:hypothetical protein
MMRTTNLAKTLFVPKEYVLCDDDDDDSNNNNEV